MRRVERPDMSDLGPKAGALAAEADRRRAQLEDNLGELGERLRPGNLVGEARAATVDRLHRLGEEIAAVGEDLATDIAQWVRRHPGQAGGGLLAAVLAAVGYWYFARRADPVPLYAAYDMEDPGMMSEDDARLRARAREGLRHLREEARDVQDRTTEAYYAARSRAAELAEEARERAHHAAEVARARAHDAAEAAREAADRAREAAGEAGEWAKQQADQHPGTVILAGLAAGLLIGALLPSDRSDKRG